MDLNRSLSFFEAAGRMEADGEPFVVITLVHGKGHIPQEPGAKMIVARDGLRWGTVGGGKVEAKAIEKARELLDRGFREPLYLTWNLTRDIGMTCGGELSYLFEPHGAQSWVVAVYGAGHVGQALTRLLSLLDCQVVCFEERKEWRERLSPHPRMKADALANPELRVESLPKDAFHVVVTQGHATDLPILLALARLSPRYVGVIGSDLKARKLRSDLLAQGAPPAFVERLHCPIGLEIGTNHPGEIAVSIAAELLQERDRLR